MKAVPQVSSLSNLRVLAETDRRYLRLMVLATHQLKLDGPATADPTPQDSFRWLFHAAQVHGEATILAAINDCREQLR